MKILDFNRGYVNLKTISYLEVVIKKEGLVYKCWLEIPGRDFYLYSFETETDAKMFRGLFCIKVQDFLESEDRKIRIDKLVQIVLNLVLGG